MRDDPRIVEALLLPFHVDGKPIGTVWIVTHDRDRKFDREDERIVGALAKFVSVAWLLWKTKVNAEELVRRHWEDLVVANGLRQGQLEWDFTGLKSYR